MIIGTVLSIALIVIMFWQGWDFGQLLVLVIAGLFVYRRIRNRRARLLKKFASKVRKVPEVRLITREQNHITVVVDKSTAKTYERVNGQMDWLNGKLFFGDPFSVSLRDSLTDAETRSLLEAPGVLYVRADVLDPDPAS